MTPPRIQFSLKRLFAATLWVAIAVTCVLTSRGLGEFEGPRFLRSAIALTTFVAAIPLVGAAAGTLLGSAKTGAIVGWIALSALVVVASVHNLHEIGLNSVDSNEWIWAAVLSALALIAEMWLFVRRRSSNHS